jgi:hypothetical protein
MGVVNTTYTFSGTDTITSSKLNNIIDDTTFTSNAIQGTTLQVVSPGKLAVNAGGITSNELASSSVSNTNVSDTAAIAGTKISPNFGSQNITTTGSVSAKNTITNGVTNNDFASKVTNTGTTNAYGLLVDAVNSPYALAVRDSSNQYRFRFGGDGTASMGGATGDSFNISSTGNVGVGTGSPSYKLDVNGDIKSRSGWFLGSRGTSGFTGLSTAENTLSGGCIIVRDDNSTFNPHGVEFYANSTERMRIQSNGNVGIGKTNPSTILDVNGTVTATAFTGPLTGNASSASTVSNSAITAAKLDGNQSGSAPIYGCRAWVSFAGRSTNGDCTIRSAGTGNVYRVARTAEGRYTVYFTTAMQDENYATITGSDANAAHKIAGVISQSAGTVDIAYSQIQTTTNRIDPTWGQVSIFR